VREAERVRGQLSLLDDGSHRGDEGLVHIGLTLASGGRLEGESKGPSSAVILVPHHVIDPDAFPIQHLFEHPNHHAPLVLVSVCNNVVYASQPPCLELVVLLVEIALSTQGLPTSTRRESLTLTKPNPVPLPVLSICSHNWRRVA